jgi:hypothetical protein
MLGKTNILIKPRTTPIEYGAGHLSSLGTYLGGNIVAEASGNPDCSAVRLIHGQGSPKRQIHGNLGR